MPKVIHFELNADNPNRTQKFYETVFDWKIDRSLGPMDCRLAVTGSDDEPGINGAITKRTEPGVTGVVVIEMPVPAVGHFCYCEDFEGNKFGLMQTDPEAK